MPLSRITHHASRINHLAFTLVELLVVISIIGILAGFTIPVMKTVKRTQFLKTASAELKQIEMALAEYKAKYGTYPPCNTNNLAFPPLYYELSGVTKVDLGGKDYYRTLDGSAKIEIKPSNDYLTHFHVAGVVNCTFGGGEDESKAVNFLTGQLANRAREVDGTNVLVTSVRGPDDDYKPLGTNGVNPFRYLRPGTNNPNSYDLWVDLSISGKINRISNWSRQSQIIQ